MPVVEDDRYRPDLPKHKMPQYKRYIISVGIIVIILLVGSIIWRSMTQQLPDNTVNITVESWYRGSENAPVTIDLYPDFTCGTCVETERMAIQVSNDLRGKIRLVYHHYPDTPLGELIAEALESAGEQGKFWEMHDRLIDDTTGDIYQVIQAAKSVGLSVDEYAFDKISTEAEGIGVNMTTLFEDLKSGRFSQKVRIAKQEAISTGVHYFGTHKQ